MLLLLLLLLIVRAVELPCLFFLPAIAPVTRIFLEGAVFPIVPVL